MPQRPHVTLAFAVLSLASAATSASPQGAPSVTNPSRRPDAPIERELVSRIDSVVLYQGRASVTRVASVELTAGFWKLRFDGLPASIESDTLEAKSSAGTILSVDYTQRRTPDASASPEALALADEIRAAEEAAGATNAVIAGLVADGAFVASVGVRAASDASSDAGTPRLELAAIDAQLKWIGTQRERIQTTLRTATSRLDAQRSALAALEARRTALGAATGSAQAAEVLLAVTEPGTITLRVSYLVTGARWEPVYSMRASPDKKSMNIEVDAMVVQASGESWDGVRLSLSTARPSRAASPPSIRPWFVDLITPTVARSPSEQIPSGMTTVFEVDALEKSDPRDRVATADKALAEQLGQEAIVSGAGPSVTYTIALPFDAPSDAQTRRRARIASFEASAKFIYQAQPAVTDGAFLRGTLSNSSPFQMLPGRASVFVNAEFVGSMEFGGASPTEEFSVYFGADSAITVTRRLLTREDKASGLFGGGLDTVSSYRTSIINATGREIPLELLDFRPVSRSSKVEVSLAANSQPLSKDPEFVQSLLPQGILRWDLAVPPTPTGGEGTLVAWTVVVSRSKDIEITPLPLE
ncbi:MAG: mucoidy inhibitor MuiA family protein [Phycisphaerales bacterium]|nr:mucoidy inhibitor MuiA family protein [Phycisphaerales bacterium]